MATKTPPPIPSLAELLAMTDDQLRASYLCGHPASMGACLMDREMDRRYRAKENPNCETARSVEMWLYRTEKDLAPLLKRLGYTIKQVTPMDWQVCYYVNTTDYTVHL